MLPEKVAKPVPVVPKYVSNKIRGTRASIKTVRSSSRCHKRKSPRRCCDEGRIVQRHELAFSDFGGFHVPVNLAADFDLARLDGLTLRQIDGQNTVGKRGFDGFRVGVVAEAEGAGE